MSHKRFPEIITKIQIIVSYHNTIYHLVILYNRQTIHYQIIIISRNTDPEIS